MGNRQDVLIQCSSDDEILTLYNDLTKQSTLLSCFELMPCFILILNNARQLVFANQNFLKAFHITDIKSILGQRPGEILQCMYFGIDDGCGTTDFCRFCGAAQALFSSIAGVMDVQECRIVQKDTNNAFEYLVKCGPLSIEDMQLNVFSLIDISDQKRRVVLERVFFHDILNEIGSIQGYIDLLQLKAFDPISEKKYKQAIANLLDRLTDDVEAQRDLLAAENNKLELIKGDVYSHDVLENVIYLYANHQVAHKKRIEIKKDSKNILFESDRRLLLRVLGNLVKNALEAIGEKQKVVVSSHYKNQKIQFLVHNDSYIPLAIQLQLFRRSFSTKGCGRGVGIFSVKLFTENFLQGKVSFTSALDKGTTFMVEYPMALDE